MNQTAQHEKLASGPIEDLIAHREHRYRVSGPALRAAMERSTSASLNELSSFTTEEASASQNDHNSTSASKDFVRSEVHEESRTRVDERATKGSAPLDVAEILRRWTHSLQSIHKQALRLARANDGLGPDLIKDGVDGNDNGHAQALRATLAEHKQHLANIQVLIKQLKESMPGMESSIASLREQLSRTMPPMMSASTSSDRLAPSREASTGQGAESVVRMGASHLELVPPSPALKLPQIFSLSTTSMGRSTQAQRARAPTHRERVSEALSAESLEGQASVQSTIKSDLEGKKEDNLASIRQAVHDAALSSNRDVLEEITIERSEPVSSAEHFFTPVVSGNPSEGVSGSTSVNNCLQESPDWSSQEYNRYEGRPLVSTLMEHMSLEHGKASKPAKCLSYNGLSQNGTTSLHNPEMLQMNNMTSELARPFSPPLLTDLSTFSDTFDDLLNTEDFELSDVALEGVWFNPAM